MRDLARDERPVAKLSFRQPRCSPSFVPLLVRYVETPQNSALVCCRLFCLQLQPQNRISSPPVLPLSLRPTSLYFFWVIAGSLKTSIFFCVCSSRHSNSALWLVLCLSVRCQTFCLSGTFFFSSGFVFLKQQNVHRGEIKPHLCASFLFDFRVVGKR